MAPKPMTWHHRAACRGMSPKVFYGPDAPKDDSWADDAKAVCAICPVKEPCLTEALIRGERYGVWGGLVPGERRRLLRDRGAA
jgi:WhiB family transcriptional regulator, redox-sensing transcriptional regulator